MGISNLTNHIIFIPPPLITDAIAVATQNEIKEKLNLLFTKLYSENIKTVIALGGMHLDYDRYPIPSFMQRINMYHNELPDTIGYDLDIYDRTTEYQLRKELESTKLNATIKEQYLVDVPPEQREYVAMVMPKREDLLKEWLASERFIVVFNMDKHYNEIKSVCRKYKNGILVNVTLHNTTFYSFGNETRESLVW